MTRRSFHFAGEAARRGLLPDEATAARRLHALQFARVVLPAAFLRAGWASATVDCAALFGTG